MAMFLATTFVVALATVAVARYFNLRRLDDPFVTAFLFVTVLWLLGAGLGGLFPGAPQLSSRTGLLLLSSYVALVVGGIAVARGTPRLPPLQPTHLALSSRVVTVLMLASLGAGFVLVLVFVLLSGGIPVLAAGGEGLRVEARAGLGYLVIAAIWLLTLPTVALVAAAYERRGARRHLIWLVVIVAAAAVAILGNRAPVLTLLIAAGWVALTARGEIPRWSWILGAGGVTLIVIAVTSMLRSGADPGVALAMDRLLWQLYVNASNLERVTQLIPGVVPYMLGESYLIDLSVLLPGPQANFSLWLKEMMGLEFSGGGITIGLVGELYANWGAGLAVLGCGVFGGMVASIRRIPRGIHREDAAFLTLLSIETAGIVQSGIASVLLYSLLPLTGLYLVMRVASVVAISRRTYPRHALMADRGGRERT